MLRPKFQDIFRVLSALEDRLLTQQAPGQSAVGDDGNRDVVLRPQLLADPDEKIVMESSYELKNLGNVVPADAHQMSPPRLPGIVLDDEDMDSEAYL